MQPAAKVRVIGPVGSGQLDKIGVVMSSARAGDVYPHTKLNPDLEIVTVALDDEGGKVRNFKRSDLEELP